MNSLSHSTEIEVLELATKKKTEKALKTIIQQKHFNLRNISIQSYFLRLSVEHKRQYILKLVNLLPSPASLFQIFSIMSLGRAKMEMYAMVDPETNFVIDKLVLDHDRMLDKNTLDETITNDIEWFCSLDENQQIQLLMRLLKMSSGSVTRSLYLPLYRIYRCKIIEFSKQKSHFSQKLNTEKKPSITYDEKDLDPKHPASIEVERQRKKWADLISKYKNEVWPPSDVPENDKNSPNDKKKKKDKRNSKKEDKALIKSVDMIQLLPIWIVKKIFCFLTTKKLVTLKAVNSYWFFVIQELLDERNARDNINALLEHMKETINPEIFKKGMEPLKEKLPDVVGQKIFYEMGAVAQELIPKKIKNQVEETLEINAKAAETDELNMDNGNFVPFPRLIKEDIELYSYKPGFLHDVGVWFDIDGEIEKQKSFLSYSLSKTVSSIKISVDNQTLSEW